MVLDKEDGKTVFLAYLTDELRKLQRFLRVHAGRRLIQKQKLRIGCKRTGDLQTALKAVRQARCDLVLVLVKALLLQKRHGLLAHALFLLGVAAEGGREHVLLRVHVLCYEDVFKNGHALPEADVLEGAGYALLCYFVRCVGYDLAEVHIAVFALIGLFHLALRMVADDGLAHELNQAVCRLINAGDTVKRSGLTGTVGADEGDYLALGDIEREVVDGNDAAELHRNVFNMENIVAHLLSPTLSSAARFLLLFSIAFVMI